MITPASGMEQSMFLKCVIHPWQGHIGEIILHWQISTLFTEFHPILLILHNLSCQWKGTVWWAEIMKSSVLLEMDSVYIVEYTKWFLAGHRGGFLSKSLQNGLKETFWKSSSEILFIRSSLSPSLMSLYRGVEYCQLLFIKPIDRASSGIIISSWSLSPQSSSYH